MNQVDNLSDDADQTTQVILEDGSVVSLELTYLPNAQLWNLGVTYGDFTAKGITLASHPNLLREFRTQIPFGLGVLSSDGFDPFDISDFLNGRVVLYILSSSDVADLEATTFGAGT